MKNLIVLFLSLLGFAVNAEAEELTFDNKGMIVRISEIEIYPQYFDEYISFAREVAEESIAKEDGVISIYPMLVQNNHNLIRILEIYKNDEVYKKHIASEHFQKYKQGTLHMVKSLNLVDTDQISAKNFNKIFKRN